MIQSVDVVNQRDRKEAKMLRILHTGDYRIGVTDDEW